MSPSPHHHGCPVLVGRLFTAQGLAKQGLKSSLFCCLWLSLISHFLDALAETLTSPLQGNAHSPCLRDLLHMAVQSKPTLLLERGSSSLRLTSPNAHRWPLLLPRPMRRQGRGFVFLLVKTQDPKEAVTYFQSFCLFVWGLIPT